MAASRVAVEAMNPTVARLISRNGAKTSSDFPSMTTPRTFGAVPGGRERQDENDGTDRSLFHGSPPGR